jgi:hypothetical protein
MTVEAFSDGLLGWIIRLAGLFWLVGSFMLFRQIRGEMVLDRMTAQLEAVARDLENEARASGELDAESAKLKNPEQDRIDRWTDRDDAARRGWIAAQAVVLGLTAVAMILLHPFASALVALLVLGQGVYFIWREHTARHAPSVEAALHARPSASTVNAGWVSLAVATVVWAAAFRGVLA